MNFLLRPRAYMAGVLGLAALAKAFACGPDFPNCYLSNSFDELATLPALSFDVELARIIPPRLSRTVAPSEALRQAVLAEQSEVRDVLLARGMPAEAVEAAVRDYRREQPPAALPREFHLYARGGVAWHADQRDAAMAAWRELLALPAEERPHRSVWAAYMLGRALCERDTEQARRASRLVRDLVAGGFADSQQLADASIGWEARAYLEDRDYLTALRLYVQQFAAGDRTAIASLQFSLARIFAVSGEERAPEAGTGTVSTLSAETSSAEPALSAIAADPQLRGIVTAWFAARGGRWASWGLAATAQFRRWIKSLPNVKDLSPEEADRWCWAAYQNGLWNEARLLASQAPRSAPASEWVRAMLLLRAGSVDAAVDHLAGAATGFAADPALAEESSRSGADEEWEPRVQPLGDSPEGQLAGVRGTLALHREQYAEALRLFLSARHWSDAAYVAERVLTVGDLVTLTRAEAPLGATGGEEEASALRRKLRHLTARRLVRAGKFDEAREFFPSDLQERFHAYVDDVKAGFNAALPTGGRAAAFWSAARTMHDFGLELQGTELEPDYAIWAGNFQWPELAQIRLGDERRFAWFRETASEEAMKAPQAPLQSSGDERERLQATPAPARRFHYRYRATELAWLGAALLPNDDPQAAVILHTAGRWIAARDPAAADLFYKALVVRCPNTDLGRRAAQRHWFVADGGCAEMRGRAAAALRLD